MLKRISKFGIKLSLVCLSLFIVSLVVLFNSNIKPKAATSKVYYVTVSVGETYETAGINYHCDEDGSYVIYGTDSTLKTYTKAETSSTQWGVEVDPDDPETGFANRYVCKANLTNLSESTTYYYQIVVGNEKSDIKSFKSAPDSGSTSFLFLTDTQSSNTSGFNKVNDLVKAIEKIDKNLNMVLMTGDIVDRGGYSAQWNSLFEGLTSLERYQQATIPGNHEYYHSNDASYINASIYNQFYNNPQNGPDDRTNSSYFFKYADALIIMLDIMPNTQDPYDLEVSKTWFKDVVRNNPSRWIIVGSHAGAITAGVYTHDAKQIWNNWSETFEECQVDLALSGHEHIYIRKDLWYQGEYNEELGVTYLVGPAAGQKDYAAQTTEGLTVKRGNYRGQIVKIQGTKMTVTLYDTTGTEYATFTLNAKRNTAPSEVTDAELLDSIECSYDEETGKGYITWTPDAWGNVTKVSCSGDSTWEQLIPSCAEAFASHTLNGLDTSKNYKYTVTMHKADGTTISKDLTLLLNPDLLPNAVTISGNKKINVGETTQLTATLTPEGCDQSVIWSSADEAIATVDENGLVTGVSAGRVRIKAVSAVNPKATRVHLIEVVATAKPETFEFSVPGDVYVGDEIKLNVVVTPLEATKKGVWDTDNYDVAQVVDGTLYAMGAGTVTITGAAESDPSLTYSLTITVYNKLSSIQINDTKSINLFETHKLSYTVNEGAKPDQTVVWSSNDSNIISVDQNGNIEALAKGSATITITCGELTHSVTISVVVVVRNISYNLDGGTLPADAPTTYVVGIGQNTLPTPSKDGYTFKGWYNGEVKVTSISKNENEDIALTAKWEQVASTQPSTEPAKKGCGCGKSIYMFEVISAITLLAFVLRKRK